MTIPVRTARVLAVMALILGVLIGWWYRGTRTVPVALLAESEGEFRAALAASETRAEAADEAAASAQARAEQAEQRLKMRQDRPLPPLAPLPSPPPTPNTPPGPKRVTGDPTAKWRAYARALELAVEQRDHRIAEQDAQLELAVFAMESWRDTANARQRGIVERDQTITVLRDRVDDLGKAAWTKAPFAIGPSVSKDGTWTVGVTLDVTRAAAWVFRR